MCGIAGAFDKVGETPLHIVSMTDSICHRGPDAHEVYSTADGLLSLGHTRLSIIDLSAGANQPMQSSDGRYTIVFNGEIYNYRSLKSELQRLDPEFQFKTTSDTEVIIKGYHHWSHAVCSRLDGMFAFAIYDNDRKVLFLARDRMGKKPLYYYLDDNRFVFASEIKSILKHTEVKAKVTVDNKALTTFLHLGYIPEPMSAYKQIRKFPAGHYGSVVENLEFHCYPFWKLNDHVSKAIVSSDADAKSQLRSLIFDAVEKRLISDVPLGAFLSGGTDSSLVTAIASKLKSAPLKTFSIGFEAEKFNELGFASSVAKHLGTDHHEYVLKEHEALSLLEKYTTHFDEPFADTSAIPTMLVSKLAREQVTVALTGDGGDELFLGYGSYDWAKRLNNKFVKIGQAQIAWLLHSLGNDRMKRASFLFQKTTADNVRSHIFSQEQYFFSQRELELLLVHPATPFAYQDPMGIQLDEAAKQAIFDLRYYLTDDLLVKVDRSSMFYGLECRCPLLDHHLIEFALKLPSTFKKRNGERKWILKEVLREFLPPNLIYREKKGFSVPLARWMKGDMIYLIEKYLDKDLVDRIGIVKYGYVKRLKSLFFEGRDYLYNRLWVLIVLHKWLDDNG